MPAGFSTGLSAGAAAAMDALHPQQIAQQRGGDDKKIAGAAKDFEALLLGQILRASHSEGGWLGVGDDGGDDAGEAAIGFGEEQLARAMAASGGVGFSKLIESGIRNRQSAENTTPGGQ